MSQQEEPIAPVEETGNKTYNNKTEGQTKLNKTHKNKPYNSGNKSYRNSYSGYNGQYMGQNQYSGQQGYYVASPIQQAPHLAAAAAAAATWNPNTYQNAYNFAQNQPQTLVKEDTVKEHSSPDEASQHIPAAPVKSAPSALAEKMKSIALERKRKLEESKAAAAAEKEAAELKAKQEEEAKLKAEEEAKAAAELKAKEEEEAKAAAELKAKQEEEAKAAAAVAAAADAAATTTSESKPTEEDVKPETEKEVESTPVESKQESLKKEGVDTKSFSSRLAKNINDSKRFSQQQSPKMNNKPPVEFIQESGIPISQWMEALKTVPDIPEGPQPYGYEVFFDLKKFAVVRDKVWFDKLTECRFFQNPQRNSKRSNDHNKSKKGYSGKNDYNESKRGKSKRGGNNDRSNRSKGDTNRIPTKGAGLAASEQEELDKLKAEEEARKLANAPKIETSASGWKPKRKTQEQVANIVTESGEEILPPSEAEKQAKSLLNKLTAENYPTVSAKLINLLNQSKFKEDKFKSVPLLVSMTIFKGCDEPHWGMIYARLLGDFMKTISADVVPFFIEDYKKKRQQERWDLEDEAEENGIPISELPPFDPSNVPNVGTPYLVIAYMLSTEFTKKITSALEQDDMLSSEDVKEEDVEMMSDEYYKVVGEKRRFLGMLKIIGYLYNINALADGDIDKIYFQMMAKLITMTNQGVFLKDDIVESFLLFATTIGPKYSKTMLGASGHEKLKAVLQLGDLAITKSLCSERMKFQFEVFSTQLMEGWENVADETIKSLEEVREEALEQARKKKQEEQRKAQEFRNGSNRRGGSKRNFSNYGNNRNNSSNNNNNNNSNNNNNNNSSSNSWSNNNDSRNDSRSTGSRAFSKKEEKVQPQKSANAFDLLSGHDE